jgi:hypothetical protein
MSGELGRATMSDIPLEKKWDLGGAYEIERHRIEEWMSSKAREAGSARDATIASALNATETRAGTVEAIFARRDDHRDAALLAKASLGELGREAPARGTVVALVILTAVAAFAEIAVFVALWLAGQGTPMVIASGVFLALGGWLVGRGIGKIVGFKDEHGKHIRGGSFTDWGAVGVGLLMIAIMAWLRSSGQQEGAWLVAAVTTAIALLMALFESLGVAARDKRKNFLGKMFNCQIWRATEFHIEDVQKRHWHEFYEHQVRALFSGAQVALKGEPGAPAAPAAQQG